MTDWHRVARFFGMILCARWFGIHAAAETANRLWTHARPPEEA